jgi:hypothetical protein
MTTTSLSDLYQGKELGMSFSTLFACAGFGVIAGPLAEGTLLARYSSTSPYLMLAVFGAIHLAFTQFMSESLPSSERRPFTMDGVNPLKFLQLFSSKTSNTLKKLVTIASFQSFLEGKNVVDIVQLWQREHLNWGVEQMKNFTVTYGILMFASGQLLTPRLLRNMSGRSFTTLTNLTNFSAFFLRGSVEKPWVFWLAVIPMLPGVNGGSAAAIKAMATDHAVAGGLGRGEFSAYFNNLRAVVVAVAPFMYGQTYAYCREAGLHPGIPFWVGGLVGALLPELLHRTLLTTAEIKEHSKAA